MHRKYLFLVALFLLPVGLSLGANYLYLKNLGEFLPLADIIQVQETSSQKCMYGTALHGDIFDYKYHGFLEAKPEVVMVGSSRAISVREGFFQKPFYNAGGGMDSIVYAKHLFEMFKLQKPKLVLWSVDYWWFHPEAFSYHRSKPPVDTRRFTIDKLFLPYSWLAHGKISVNQFASTVLGVDPTPGECNFGVQAYEERNGFIPDGSYYWTSRVTGNEPWRPQGFSLEAENVALGADHFQHGSEPNKENVADFIDLIHSVEAEGIPLVVIFPPLSPSTFGDMQKLPQDFAYIPKLFSALQAAGISIYNFQDPKTVGTTDCEFLSGTHGGEVTYARLFQKILSKAPNLGSFFNKTALSDAVKNHAGSFILPALDVTRTPETDYLRIGCQK